MHKNWEYWKFDQNDNDTFGSGVYICEGFEIFVQAYEFHDGENALKESEKILDWVLEEKDSLKKYIIDNCYTKTILTCGLNLDRATSSEELENLLREKGNECIEPFATKEHFLQYLQPNELVISFQKGFGVAFTAFGDTELADALGGHGPIVEIDDDFSILGSAGFSG